MTGTVKEAALDGALPQAAYDRDQKQGAHHGPGEGRAVPRSAGRESWTRRLQGGGPSVQPLETNARRGACLS